MVLTYGHVYKHIMCVHVYIRVYICVYIRVSIICISVYKKQTGKSDVERERETEDRRLY